MAIFEFNKPETFQPAIDKGWYELLQLDPEKVQEHANVEFDPAARTYTIPVLGKEYKAVLDHKTIHHPDRTDEHIRGALTVLVLHYLINSKQMSLRNKLISYRELPNGMVFYNAFRNIAINPVAQKFGSDLEGFEKRALELGGHKTTLGELSFEFKIFPRVPVTYILWAGDDEIPAAANILFDISAQEHMHTEDLAEVGEVITHHLVSE